MTSFRSRSRFCSCSLSEVDTVRGGIFAILATISSISFATDRFLRRLSGGWIFTARADFVDHVDRLVGQVSVVDVLGRKLDRRAHRAGAVVDAVMLLVVRLQTLRGS